jgi:hypothetical protein
LNLHVSIIDQHLKLSPDERATEMALTLTKALVALRMSRPVNERASQQIKAARADIMRQLRAAA